MPRTSAAKKVQRRLNFDSGAAEKEREATRKAEQPEKQPPPTSSPERKKRLRPAAVTPDEDDSKKSSKKKKVATLPPEPDHIPKYVYRNVGYRRRSKDSSKINKKRKVFDWIVQHYEIPPDLETSRRYGPLSGQSYEERVVAAYVLGNLSPVGGATRQVICVACATVGHVRNECPTLI